MSNILILKTSTDATMDLLFSELSSNHHIDCLIQTSQLERYRKVYPNIHLIDIRQEDFYEMPKDVIVNLSQKEYEQTYITFTGYVGHNYGDVMRIVDKINSKEIFFYNCRGDKILIPEKNIWKDFICKIYILFIDWIYNIMR